MRIEALRLDSSLLTMEEMERYSFILGDNTMRDTLLRAQDECDEESETYRRVRELEGDLEESEDQLAQAQDERDHLRDGMEAFAKFLRSGKTLSAEQLLAAASSLDAYLEHPEYRGAADTMDDALSALGA